MFVAPNKTTAPTRNLTQICPICRLQGEKEHLVAGRHLWWLYTYFVLPQITLPVYGSMLRWKQSNHGRPDCHGTGKYLPTLPKTSMAMKSSFSIVHLQMEDFPLLF